MKNWILSLQFIFKPAYWIMNYPYSKYHDEALNYLLDRYDFTEINNYTALLGEHEIWIENHPYASMVIENFPCFENRSRPSRLTIHRAARKINAIKKNKQNQINEFLKSIKNK